MESGKGLPKGLNIMSDWDRKTERREGFLRRKKARNNSKDKKRNRHHKDEIKYKYPSKEEA